MIKTAIEILSDQAGDEGWDISRIMKADNTFGINMQTQPLISPIQALKAMEAYAATQCSSMRKALEEADEYLSQTVYENGKPKQLNYIGAGSKLHQKFKSALSPVSVQPAPQGVQSDIQCKCPEDKKHGTTSIDCCNYCGLPTEKFWNRGPVDPYKEGDEKDFLTKQS